MKNAKAQTPFLFMGGSMDRGGLSSRTDGAKAPSWSVRKFLIPPCPNILRRKLVEGEVRATAHILGNGTVESVRGISGPERFYEVVEWAVRRWEFDVADKDPIDLDLTFKFSLDRNESDACVFQVSGTLPDRFEITVNTGPRMQG